MNLLSMRTIIPGKAWVGRDSLNALLTRLALWGTYLMLALLSVQRDDMVPLKIPLGSMRLSEIVAAAVLVVLVVRSLVRPTQPLKGPKRITMLIGLFLGVMFLSSFMSAQITWGPNEHVFIRRLDREVPFIKSYTTMLAWLLGIAVFYVIVLVIDTPDRLKQAFQWWIVGGAICSAVGIYSAPAAMFGWPLGDLLGVSWRGANATEWGDDRLPRIIGLAQEPRHLAIFLAAMLPFLVLVTMRKVYVLPRIVQWTCLVICGLAYLLTLSRSTVVYGVALLGLFLIFVPFAEKRLRLGRFLRMLIAITLLVGALGAVVNLLLQMFGLPDILTVAGLQFESLVDTRNYSNWQQDAAWTIGWRAFRDYPLLGVGIGNLSFFADRYIPPQPDWLGIGAYWTAVPVNNIYLDLLSEMGLVGLVAFGLFVTYLTRQGWRATRKAGPTGSTIVLGLLGGFLMLLIAFVFFSAFFFAYVWALIGLSFVSARLVLRQPDCLECM